MIENIIHADPLISLNFSTSVLYISDYKERGNISGAVKVKNISVCNHFRRYVVDYHNQVEFQDDDNDFDELNFIYKRARESIFSRSKSDTPPLFGLEQLLCLFLTCHKDVIRYRGNKYRISRAVVKIRKVECL